MGAKTNTCTTYFCNEKCPSTCWEEFKRLAHRKAIHPDSIIWNGRKAGTPACDKIRQTMGGANDAWKRVFSKMITEYVKQCGGSLYWGNPCTRTPARPADGWMNWGKKLVPDYCHACKKDDFCPGQELLQTTDKPETAHSTRNVKRSNRLDRLLHDVQIEANR